MAQNCVFVTKDAVFGIIILTLYIQNQNRHLIGIILVLHLFKYHGIFSDIFVYTAIENNVSIDNISISK